MTLAFLHGIVLAFGLIIPLGVQNVFIFNQGMYHRKWRKALPVAITASICDNLLILIAVLGVSVIVLTIAWFKYLLGLTGVIFLLYMGYITWKNQPAAFSQSDGKNAWPLGKQVLFTATVSLLNPHAIIDTVGVIGTSSLAYPEPSVRMAFTASTMFISWFWFFFLITAGHFLGRMDNVVRIQRIVNKVSAVIMWLSSYLMIQVLFNR